MSPDEILKRLALRCVDGRDEASKRPDGVRYEMEGFIGVGWWDSKIYRIELAKRALTPRPCGRFECTEGQAAACEHDCPVRRN